MSAKSATHIRAKLPPYFAIDEPLLSFSASDPSARDIHPLRGLINLGPYSKSFTSYSPRIRIATVGPESARKDVAKLLTSLRGMHKPNDRKDYVPTYPGFAKIFGVDFERAPNPAHVAWPDNINGAQGQSPAAVVADLLNQALDRLATVRDQFDVVSVHLPDAWAAACRSSTFDAHDFLKAMAAQRGIPTQVLNDRAFTFGYHASLAWRLSIALYVKAGGVPWKLAPMPGVPDHTAYIGLAYALRGDPRTANYVVCCSQVFDADGGGMQFVAFEAHDPVSSAEDARRNPYLGRADMRAVLARSLTLYQARNGGALPRRVVIHKTTAFRESEIAGAADALEAIPEMDCIEVTSNVAWRGVWLRESHTPGKRSEPNGYPVVRGTMIHRSGTSALLWVAGNAPTASQRGNYYQGQKSIPRPIILTRHAGCGPLEIMALEALALTKMDWNNDALYDPVPVTVRYSQRLARTIANVSNLPSVAYPYRMFM